ncbi:MAG: right-handed parallel beta-helix repeat-containing protein [Verrucomicrobiales bacterium]|nr:right-handed parallel beta-helix repeat-containing protein [Verrucomicrobiales bacterium]
MAQWSVGVNSDLTYRRIVASVAKHATDLTWATSALTLWDLNDNGTAVGWENYEGLVNATFDNAGADRIQELGLFYDLVALDPGATVPRRLGVHTYVRQLWNNVIRLRPVAIGVNNRDGLLGNYPIRNRLTGEEFGGDFLGNTSGEYAFLAPGTVGGALDLNDRGEVIGVAPYREPDGTLSSQPALWNPGLRWLREVVGYTGEGKLQPSKINNLGEIVGQISEKGNVIRMFLWLPRPSYGLGAGLNTLFSVTNTWLEAIDLNDQGNILWSYGTAPNNNVYLWSERRSIALRQFVPASSDLFPRRGGASSGWSINEYGWISGWGLPNQGQQLVPIVMRPLADAEAFLSTNQVRVGETVTFTLRIRNHASTPSTLGLPIGFRFNGSAKFELVGTPTPPAPRVVPAFGSFEIRQQIRATASGSSRWYSQGRLISGGVTNDTPIAYAETLRVLDRADLLIKRAVEPDAAYALNDEYQATPQGRQVRTNSVGASEVSEFHVRVENDDTRSRTFRLKADEGSNGEGWEVRHQFGTADVSSAVRSGAGWVMPELAPGRFHQMTLRVTGTPNSVGDVKRVVYTLEPSNEPGEIRDTVEAVTEVGGEIVVNSTGDESDADPYDRVADVDLLKPGLQTTLRSAIEVGNQRPGKDRIRFAIPAEGNTFDGGNPRLFPMTGLPIITDAVDLDGWSQRPNAETPPVQLSGGLIVAEGPFPVVRERFDEWPENASAAHGLTLRANGSRISGFVINQFPLFGIRFEGDGNVIEGNFIGTDATGLQGRANGLQAGLDTGLLQSVVGGGISGAGSYNRIGGPGERSGNLVSGVSDAYLEMAGDDLQVAGPAVQIAGTANIVQGNRIGVDRSGERAVESASVARNRMMSGVIVQGDANLVGGPAPQEGNIIAACYDSGVAVVGRWNVIQGNRIGLGRLGRAVFARNPTDLVYGLAATVGIDVRGEANDVGGVAPGEGNVIGDCQIGVAVRAAPLSADRNRIQGNRIGLEAQSDTAVPLRLAGIRVEGANEGLIRSNVVAHVEEGNGIEILGAGVFRPTGTLLEGNRVFSHGHARPAPTAGYGAGILVGSGGRHHIFNNLIWDNQYLGIQLFDADTPRSWNNDDGDTDDGPNGLQNHPELIRAIAGDAVEIQGSLRTTTAELFREPRRYELELFFSDQASVTTFGGGEGKNLLAVSQQMVDASGISQFRVFVHEPALLPGYWVTSTITDPEGNTSMFSPAILVQGPVDNDSDAISDRVEDRVSARNARPPLSLHDRQREAFESSPGDGVGNGDGNGDGVPDSRQPGVTSFPTVMGEWSTVVAPGAGELRDVRPATLLDPGSLPAHMVFPMGTIDMTLVNAGVGASISLTWIRHGAPMVSRMYARQATPGGSTHQWVSIDANASGDEIRFTLVDGGPADLDQVANGIIQVALLPADPVLPGPTLTIEVLPRGFAERYVPIRVGEQWIWTTNHVPRTASVLSWPSSVTNMGVEYADATTFNQAWMAMEGTPARSGEWNQVTNVSTSPDRMFRLRRVP